ncbi:MAG TPA: FAD-binding oxidoreductase [Candidatus Limnocylindria bacterium]|nr:FAD-binding oxidoreductase [Candidatus Limnocylindria bacterium]
MSSDFGAGLGVSALTEPQGSFRGELVTPGHHAYEKLRRVWNGSINRRPAAILRCTTPEDVTTAVRVARESALAVAVRSGGHSFPGLSVGDDALVIDLRLMNRVEVDAERRVVRVGAGALLGELDAATQTHGLVVPAGIVTHTGVAGLTLGGGIGWIMRKYGLSIDSLLSVELVTANGDLVTASESENADLFWGVRGGGGNFGIVTEFEFQAHPLGPQVLAGTAFWPIEDARRVLRFYRDWLADCPDELMTIVVTRRAPALPIVPPEVVGKHIVGVAACYAGSVEQGEKVLEPLRSFGSPIVDAYQRKPFVAQQQMFDPSFEPGWWYYVRACDVAELSDEVIDIVVDYGRRIVSPISSVALWQMGGAVARVSDDETAFHGRAAGFTFNINGNTYTADGFDEERQWARNYWDALAPHHTSVYVNFLMEEGEERVRQAYGPVKYDRLKALKRKYDPTNLFRLNQNIRPD